ncbi:MAG TPA: hypothetical protein VKP13_05605 [Nitrospira sp.]|nr:hypothetical protein [Nitrospira sp.]
MTELKPLTYDEHKAAEAAFRGCPPDPDWTETARLLYAKLSAAIAQRGGPALRSDDQASPTVSR